jgi:hypothetical protein
MADGGVGAIIVFLIIGGVAVAWGAIQSSEDKRKKAEREAERRAAAERKYNGTPYVEDILNGLIRQGMTGEMVVDAWGHPEAVDRKVYKTKVKETWKYGPGPRRTFANKVVLENDIVVGWESR